MRNVSKAFTLLELLIVIAIISILYSIAAANVTGMQMEARISKCNGDLRTIQLAVDSYLKNNNVCPKEADYEVILRNEIPNIMTSELMDPFGATYNTLYSYRTSPNHQNYVVYSVGMGRDGSANIGDDGKLIVRGAPIFATNGYL